MTSRTSKPSKRLQPMSRLIQLAIRQSRTMWIPHENNKGILIDGARGIFHDVGNVREHLCSKHINLRSVAWVSRKLDTFEGIIERPINELKWCAAFFEFGQHLPDFLRRDDIIKLKDCPNFIEMPHHPDFIRIADFLAKRPTSPAFAARLLKIEEEMIHHFYFTAWHANCIDHVNRRDFHEALSEQYNSPANSRSGKLRAILTSDVRDLLDFPAMTAIRQVLTTDVSVLWKAAANSRLNQGIHKVLQTDVIDILTADLLAPFKQANASLAQPVSNEFLKESLQHPHLVPVQKHQSSLAKLDTVTFAASQVELGLKKQQHIA